MNVVYSLSDKNIKELHQLFKQEWWTQHRSLEETKNCVDGSSLNIGILNHDNVLIAYARVITDFTFKALIFDIIVADDQRGNGLGDQLIHLIKTHKRLASINTFELYCLPDMFSFYEKHGFSTDVNGLKLMRLTHSDDRR